MGCILFLEEGTECLGEETSMSWVLLAWAIVLEVTGTTKYEALPGCLGHARGSCRYRNEKRQHPSQPANFGPYRDQR
jgi:hypothetical protein